ncbi:MAG: hypothetical protein GY716_02295 [bacterium]|nr:hypothetical protein [bacterium]
MAESRFHRPTLISMIVSALLIFIGAVRGLSYLQDPVIGDRVRDSIFWFLAYQPTIYVNAQFFKVLATPSIVGMMYFIFYFLNQRHAKVPSYEGALPKPRLDFRSPWLRLILTTLATAHWLLIEVAKFSQREEFYPYSVLENRTVNALALITGQVISFFAMKYLCFEPLREGDE